ncbi:MAG: hypothetical protein C4K49_06370 [Candidatus Thorarchaeota archaeon]|nr:MAG: hypothetical protein C4K49_06370 [Candidatus Thorarchaeota archaeon]
MARNDLHFLDIANNGDLVLRLRGQTITFDEITKRVKVEYSKREDYTSSFTLRIPQLIQHQVLKLRAAFANAMRNLDYQGAFRGVYPVKVNQRADSIVPILDVDSEYGLEVGTKAELLLVKKLTANQKHRLIICNGAKDPEYLDMISRYSEEGYDLHTSVESSHEARLITGLFEPERTNLILRLKPYVTARGRWSHSAGRESKFGLSIHDLFDVIELLKEQGFRDTVRTVLGHIGSQVAAIEDFRPFAAYLAHAFCEIRRVGLRNLKTIDFGGGLPTDYTSSYPSDLMDQYASMIIQGVKDEIGVHSRGGVTPDIMVESGRSLTAPGSLIVVKATEVRSLFPTDVELAEEDVRERNTWSVRIRNSTSVTELVEIWNEFLASKAALPKLLDELRARERLIGDLRSELRQQLARLVARTMRADSFLETIWSPDYIVIGNFSVFNCAADHVLANQYFPVLPIRDLHVRPETTVRLVDITCDSDGEISEFQRKGVDEMWLTRDYRPVAMPTQEIGIGIPVGYIKNVEESYFVIALTGAYQDVIEMDHNLLGDLPDVIIHLTDDDKWCITWATGAESMAKILERIGYSEMGDRKDPYMSDRKQ